MERAKGGTSMATALVIEDRIESRHEYLALSGDPDSDERLPKELHIVVNHRAEERFIVSVESFLGSLPGVQANRFVPENEHWFGFVLSGDCDIEVVQEHLLGAMRGGVYRLALIDYGTDEIEDFTDATMDELTTSEYPAYEEPSIA